LDIGLLQDDPQKNLKIVLNVDHQVGVRNVEEPKRKYLKRKIIPMPANLIRINNSKKLEWVVHDSKMPKLIKWLNKWGRRGNSDLDKITWDVVVL